MPRIEHEFLQDQRTERKMRIGSVDKATSITLTKQMKRQSTSTAVAITQHAAISKSSAVAQNSEECVVGRRVKAGAQDFSRFFSSSTSGSFSSGISYRAWTQTEVTRNMTSVDNVARTAERYDISDTAAAAIASAALLDAGFIKPEDLLMVIDRNKVRRARLALRAQNVQNFVGETVHALFYDGRKDSTLQMKFGRLTQVIEYHISIVREPGSIFLSHVTVQSSGALCITETVMNRLTDKLIDDQTIKAICLMVKTQMSVQKEVLFNRLKMN